MVSNQLSLYPKKVRKKKPKAQNKSKQGKYMLTKNDQIESHKWIEKPMNLKGVFK